MPYAKYSKLSGEWFWTYRTFFQVDCFRKASRTSQDRAHPAQDSHSSMGQCGVVRLVAGAGGFRTRITVQLPKNERRRFDPEDWNTTTSIHLPHNEIAMGEMVNMVGKGWTNSCKLVAIVGKRLLPWLTRLTSGALWRQGRGRTSCSNLGAHEALTGVDAQHH